MIQARHRPRGFMARGFTLVELIVTLAIVGVLASMAMPLAELTVQRAKEQTLRESLRTIRGALDAYHEASGNGAIAKAADASGYPPSLELLVTGVPNAKDSSLGKIYFLRRLPADPFYDGPADTPPEETWGLRSYASDADSPAPGKDVFDVYSTSERLGLNGKPYKQW